MNNQQHLNPAFIRQLQSFEGSDEQVAFGSPAEGPFGNKTASRSGKLIINADDWGRDQETTARILSCVARGSISSVSAMVFMQDSERAAGIAREQEIDAGLHLNFTTAFSAANCSAQLVQHQQRIARCLWRYRLARALFHPTLMRSFEYVVSAQLEEFCRLYGRMPQRLDSLRWKWRHTLPIPTNTSSYLAVKFAGWQELFVLPVGSRSELARLIFV